MERKRRRARWPPFPREIAADGTLQVRGQGSQEGVKAVLKGGRGGVTQKTTGRCVAEHAAEVFT